MKILQICSTMSLGGGERHVTDLARGLIERGHELHLAVRPRSPVPNLLRDASVTWHELPLRNSLDPASIRGLSRIICRERIDVVHAHVARDYLVAGLAVRLARRSQTVKLFLTRHHYLPVKANWAYAWAIGLLTRFIAVSQSVEHGLRSAFPRFRDRILTVPNWIDIRRVGRLPRDEARRSLGIQQPIVVGVVGQLTPLKRQDYLIRSAARLINTGVCPDVEFVIAGAPGPHREDADYAESVRQLIETLGVRDHVRMTGFVENVAEKMRAFDLLVLPSESEAFPLVLLEAMASGCAAIASRSGGMTEIIDHERTGLLVDPNDESGWDAAIMSLLRDAARREQFAAAGSADTRKRFDREAVISQIESLYREAT